MLPDPDLSQADNRHGNALRPALDQTVPGVAYRDLAAIHQHLAHRKSTALPRLGTQTPASELPGLLQRLRWAQGCLR